MTTLQESLELDFDETNPNLINGNHNKNNSGSESGELSDESGEIPDSDNEAGNNPKKNLMRDKFEKRRERLGSTSPPRYDGRNSRGPPARRGDKEGYVIDYSQPREFIKDENDMIYDPISGKNFEPFRRCRYYNQGKCTYGNDCKFVHDNGPLTERDLYSTREIHRYGMDGSALVKSTIESEDFHAIKREQRRIETYTDLDTSLDDIVKANNPHANSRRTVKAEYHEESNQYDERSRLQGRLGSRSGDSHLQPIDARNRIHGPRINKSNVNLNQGNSDHTYTPQHLKDGAMNRPGNSDVLTSSWSLSIMHSRAKKGLISNTEVEKKKKQLESITANGPLPVAGSRVGLLGQSPGLMNNMNGKNGRLGHGSGKTITKIKTNSELKAEIASLEKSIEDKKAKIEIDKIRNLMRSDAEDQQTVDTIIDKSSTDVQAIVESRIESRKNYKSKMAALYKSSQYANVKLESPGALEKLKEEYKKKELDKQQRKLAKKQAKKEAKMLKKQQKLVKLEEKVKDKTKENKMKKKFEEMERQRLLELQLQQPNSIESDSDSSSSSSSSSSSDSDSSDSSDSDSRYVFSKSYCSYFSYYGVKMSKIFKHFVWIT